MHKKKTAPIKYCLAYSAIYDYLIVINSINLDLTINDLKTKTPMTETTKNSPNATKIIDGINGRLSI